jgi:malonyl-CoA/methylmalonyl-CoA synthetase
MNLDDLFALGRARGAERLALAFRDADGDSVRYSHGELEAAAQRAAAWLAGRGLRRGDRVALFLSNRPEFVFATLGALRLGAVVVPINLAYRHRELAHIVSDAEPRLIVSEAAHSAVLEELAPEERASVAGILLAEDLRAADPGSTDRPTIEGDDLAFLLYTSGTTGRSKGAMLSHDAILSTVAALHLAWAWTPADVLLLALPLFHTHGLFVGLHAALGAGAAVQLRKKFDASQTLADLASGEPTLFFGVPTMYTRLLAELRQGGRSAWPRVRLCCSGSAPLPPETFAAFAELTGHAILERYGMTETGMLLSNPLLGRRRPGTVGRPLPGVSARIVDADGTDVAAGDDGQLVVRGPNVFSGYWRAPEKTTTSFVHDGEGRRWFATGDLARRDPEDGAITLLGRGHDLIISGGFNIYPREIEEVLAAFPGVREVAVAAWPHPEWGEVPAAFVVAERPLAEEDLVAHCRGQLAGFKCPRVFRFVEALPRNALGKVQKHLLPR